MPADATIVPLRSEMPGAPAARREAPHEQPQRSPREQPEQPSRELPAREIERSSEPEKAPQSPPPDVGCAGRCFRCCRSR
jgi:hypothetical protein